MRVVLLAAILAGPFAQGQTAGDPGIGSSRDEVIARYGPPRATMSAGTREILTFASGRVILENGRVTRMDTPRAGAAEQPPPRARAPAPVAPAPPAARPPPAEREPWLTDFTAAQAEAAASHRRILALFTGSDWCPACIEFEQNVAHHPDFLATTRPSFVLLRLDYPMQHALPPALRAQNEALRRRYTIKAYPTLLILSADGATSVKVDNTVSRHADGITDFYVQAVDEARHEKPGEKKWWWPF